MGVEVEGKMYYLERSESITTSDGDYIRTEVYTILISASVLKDNFSKRVRQSLKKIKKDKSIMILFAEKEYATVILNKSDYIERCNHHIKNSPYQDLKNNPANKIKWEGDKLIKGLKDQNIISEELTERFNLWTRKPLNSMELQKYIKKAFPNDQ